MPKGAQVLCLSGREMAPTRQRPLLKVPEMKIIWEEQLVDPPIAYITSVNIMYSIVLTCK